MITVVHKVNGIVTLDKVLSGEEEKAFLARPGNWSAPASLTPTPYNGSAQWRALHELAISDGVTTTWLDTWAADLPVFGCKCKPHWQEELAANPLPEANQFVWSVDRHNAVNARLGKSILTQEQARAIYAR